jgi:hypothetical protein
MVATRTAQLLHHVKSGILDPADTALLEHTSARQLVDELRCAYPLTYQERRIGKKWEISLARSVRAEIVSRPFAEGILVSFRLVPVYVNCLALDVENDTITGISRRTRLAVWAVHKPEPGLALKSGGGFKLDNMPDGWIIKPMRKRLVKLATQFLRQRGWRFDHLKQLIPVP